MFSCTLKMSTSILNRPSDRGRASSTRRRTCLSGRGCTRSRILPAAAGRFRSRSPILLRSNGAPSEFSSDSEIRALDCAPRFTGKVLKGGN